MLKIKELREEKRITQQEMASVLGISRQVYANWENEINQPDFKMFIRLADFFQVSADYLLGRSDDLGNVTVQSSAPALTKREGELIELFRTLTPFLQDTALDAVRRLAGKSGASGSSSSSARSS